MGFFDNMRKISGGHGQGPDEARTCERCRNFAYCRRRAMGGNATCDNYDEKA